MQTTQTDVRPIHRWTVEHCYSGVCNGITAAAAEAGAGENRSHWEKQ